MLPSATTQHLAYAFMTNAKASGDGVRRYAACGMKPPHLDYLSRGEFGGGVPFARHESPLRARVPKVVGPSTDEKMFRVDARGIVATVANVQAGRNRTVDQSPSNAMGLEFNVVSCETSIPAPQLSSRPLPTSIRAQSRSCPKRVEEILIVQCREHG